jgi:hypothetical protein
MKKLILALALLIQAAPAFASADSKVIASVSNITNKIQGVTLTEDGVVNVILRERHRPITQQLSEATAQRLNWLAVTLANAEITTEHRRVVCMMMVNPMFMPSLSIAPYNENKAEWESGEPKTVLTTSNCATPTAILPADGHDYATATALKEVLTVLATEALANVR